MSKATKEELVIAARKRVTQWRKDTGVKRLNGFFKPELLDQVKTLYREHRITAAEVLEAGIQHYQKEINMKKT